uniref:Uncharacterized protein n=1 Tax=Glossina austeni TaxID=7395 RepID=A0A1A9VJ83_GLOAU
MYNELPSDLKSIAMVNREYARKTTSVQSKLITTFDKQVGDAHTADCKRNNTSIDIHDPFAWLKTVFSPKTVCKRHTGKTNESIKKKKEEERKNLVEILFTTPGTNHCARIAVQDKWHTIFIIEDLVFVEIMKTLHEN